MSNESADTLPGLIYESSEEVVRLTLNRPERRNVLSRKMLEDLDVALDRISGERAARVVVIAARGTVFCAGHDLNEMIGCDEDACRDLFSACTRVMQRLRTLPQPVIARVHRLATAAGCQLAAACDLVVAAEEAQFATPGINIGLFCSTPMVPLVRAIPAKPALEMLLTGEPISALRAWQLGLVNRVVPQEQLDEAIQQMVDAIVRSSPEVIRLGKAAFYEGLPLDEQTAYERAVETISGNAMLPDAQEGFQAFLEKRPPQWSRIS